MTSFLNAMPGAVAQGLIWGIMAIGVYLTYQILSISDLTVDGSFCTGGAVCVVMMTAGYNVWVAMLAAPWPVCWRVWPPAFSTPSAVFRHFVRHSHSAGTVVREPGHYGHEVQYPIERE